MKNGWIQLSLDKEKNVRQDIYESIKSSKVSLKVGSNYEGKKDFSMELMWDDVIGVVSGFMLEEKNGSVSFYPLSTCALIAGDQLKVDFSQMVIDNFRFQKLTVSMTLGELFEEFDLQTP